MLDASNDNGPAKNYPITVRIFDIDYSRVMTKFFEMILIAGANASPAAAMISSVDKQLKTIQIPWEYCLAIGVDNKNTNIGDHKSIKSCTLQKNSTIIMSDCVCCILGKASCKASSLFSNILRQLALKTQTNKSSKRKNLLIGCNLNFVFQKYTYFSINLLCQAFQYLFLQREQPLIYFIS